MTDWQKGDLALCVCHFELNAASHGLDMPKKGRVYGVTNVAPHPYGEPWGAVALRLDGVLDMGAGSGWNSNMFRKVTPPKPTADDREVIDLMAGKKAPA